MLETNWWGKSIMSTVERDFKLHHYHYIQYTYIVLHVLCTHSALCSQTKVRNIQMSISSYITKKEEENNWIKVVDLKQHLFACSNQQLHIYTYPNYKSMYNISSHGLDILASRLTKLVPFLCSTSDWSDEEKNQMKRKFKWK